MLVLGPKRPVRTSCQARGDVQDDQVDRGERDRERIVSVRDGRTDSARRPDGSSGRDAAYVAGLLDDSSCSDEPDPGHQALEHVGLLVAVLPRKQLLAEEHIHARSHRHEGKDPQADVGM